METHTNVFIEIDVAKLRNAIVIADNERENELRYFCEVDSSPDTMRRVIQRIADKHGRSHFAAGLALQDRAFIGWITSMGLSCDVVTQSLFPHKPGEREAHRRAGDRFADRFWSVALVCLRFTYGLTYGGGIDRTS